MKKKASSSSEQEPKSLNYSSSNHDYSDNSSDSYPSNNEAKKTQALAPENPNIPRGQLFDPIQEVWSRGQDALSRAIEMKQTLDDVSNLTNLMNRLDKEHNINVYKIVDFLERLYDCKKKNSCNQSYREVFSFYQENLINSIKAPHYEEYINKNHNYPEFHPDKVTDALKHMNMLGKFKELRRDERNNILKLAYFVLYCQFGPVDPTNITSSFHIYYDLIKKIENLE